MVTVNLYIDNCIKREDGKYDLSCTLVNLDEAIKMYTFMYGELDEDIPAFVKIIGISGNFKRNQNYQMTFDDPSKIGLNKYGDVYIVKLS